MDVRPVCVLFVMLLVGCGGGGGALPSPQAPLSPPAADLHPLRILFLDEATEVYRGSGGTDTPIEGQTMTTMQFIDSLDADGLGPWANTDNVVAYMDGWGILPVITRHNGEYRGFVVGVEPPSFEELTFTPNTYTYAGGLLGVDQEGKHIEGTVDLVANLSNLHVTLNIRDLADATGGVFLDGDLYYDLAIYGNTFRSFNRQGNDPGRVSGSFFGAVEGTEYVGGVVLHPDMTAVFAGEQTSHSSDPSTP